MGESERYKVMLKEVIEATENEKIQTSEEMIRTLIDELTNKIGVKSNHQLSK
jgi:hypothetical protein